MNVLGGTLPDLAIRIDHYVHFVAGSADPRLDTILAHLGVLMAGVADIKTKLDALTAKVSDEGTVIDSAVTLLNGLAAIIADLKTQLAAAIAANDPAALQAVADQLDALGTKVDADKQKIGDAVQADGSQA